MNAQVLEVSVSDFRPYPRVEPKMVQAEREELDNMILQMRELLRLNPAAAPGIVEELRWRSEAIGYTPGTIHALRFQSRLIRITNVEEAHTLLQDALALCEPLNDMELKGIVLSDLAVHYDLVLDLNHALEYNLRAIAAFQFVAAPMPLPTILANAGAAYCTLGDYATGLSYFEEAYKTAQRLGDSYGTALSQFNIARMRTEFGAFVEAQSHTKQALEIVRALEHKSLEAQLLLLSGRQELGLGNPEEALFHFDRAADLACLVKEPQHLCYIYAGMGEAYQALQHDEEAERHFQVALQHACSMEYAYGEVEARRRLGTFLISHGRLPEAKEQFLATIALCEKIHELKALYEAYAEMSRLCEREGDTAGTLLYFRRYHEAERELYSQEALQKMSSVVIRLGVEKAQKEAEIERLRNVELQAAHEKVSRLLEQVQNQAKELERQATHDGLTGLYNRRYLDDYIAREFAQAKRSEIPVSVIIADLDNFKMINDRFSHGVGDYVLRTVAMLFRDYCRQTDVIARYGGEEFVVVMQHTKATEAASVCEQLRHAVETFPWHTAHPDLVVTLSIGIEEDFTSSNHEQLLSLADKRLYEAKRNGKNRICLA